MNIDGNKEITVNGLSCVAMAIQNGLLALAHMPDCCEEATLLRSSFYHSALEAAKVIASALGKEALENLCTDPETKTAFEHGFTAGQLVPLMNVLAAQGKLEKKDEKKDEPKPKPECKNESAAALREALKSIKSFKGKPELN